MPKKEVFPATPNNHPPENFEDVSEPRDSYLGARETYKHDETPSNIFTPTEKSKNFESANKQ